MNDKNLIFKFEPLQKEDIIGNSGTAWGTNYKINFSVNKIKFCAEYSSTTRNGDNCIEIFHENSLVADKIRYDCFRWNEEKICQIIKDAFLKDSRLKKFLFIEQEKKFINFKSKIFTNLLKNCEWI